MNAFVISKRFDGDYKFSFASRKGYTIFTSIPYKEKSDCEQIIAEIQGNPAAFTFTKKRTGSGKYFFLIEKGDEMLARSRKFSTELLLQKGIEQITKNVSTAETLDFSENEDVFADADENPEPPSG